MAEGSGARARWRDALVLTALTGFIVSGLLYYSNGLDEEPNDKATTSAVQDSVAPTASPGDDVTATDGGATSATPTPSSTPSSAPSTSSPPPDAEPRGTCWNGRETASLRNCRLPTGVRGLEYVFPSFAEDRLAFCHEADTDPDSYPVVESYECFLELDGQSVTVIYEQVDASERVRTWLLQRMGKDAMREVKGSNGGRTYFTDTRNLPSRYTGFYNRFPYVASVFASSPRAAKQAFEELVLMRPESRIRGQRKG